MNIMRRAEMLNRRAASRKSKPDEIIDKLAITEGSIVADIGPGGGYFTRRFAFKAGAVHALDINPEWIEMLRDQTESEGWENIFCHKVGEFPETYPNRKFDLVFMRNVCHHIGDKEKFFSELKDRLFEGGRVAIIDYKPGRPWTFTGLMGHFIDQDELIETMMDNGYIFEESHGFLQGQSFNIFKCA